MESLKFAFDTLIVGTLALPWLAILVRMFAPGLFTDEAKKNFPLLTALPENTRDAVTGALMIAMGYLLGSAISRVSSDFFDDEFWWKLPKESSIRKSVYKDEYCGAKIGIADIKSPVEMRPKMELPALCSDDESKPDKPDFVPEYFRFQEGKLLLAGEEKNARLKEFHDQIVVLRGAAMNGLILLSLCIFGLCAELRRGLTWRQWPTPLTYLPAGASVVYGFLSMWQHFYSAAKVANVSNIVKATSVSPYSDPPLAELVLLLVGIVGLLADSHEASSRFYRNACWLALIFSVISYGGWWWTEVIYDQQVIHSFHTL
jgi:hypothetical protein